MITGDGNKTTADARVVEATEAGVMVVEATAAVEAGVMVVEVTAVAEVVEAAGVEDFWVSSQRHRSQRVGQGKLHIPPATSESAYPVYSFPGHHMPATSGKSAVHRRSNCKNM